MKNTTLVMGILAVLATLSGCGIGDAGGVGVGGGGGVGSDTGSYNAGRARREEIVTTRNAIGSGGGEDPASAFGASTSGASAARRSPTTSASRATPRTPARCLSSPPRCV